MHGKFTPYKKDEEVLTQKTVTAKSSRTTFIKRKENESKT